MLNVYFDRLFSDPLRTVALFMLLVLFLWVLWVRAAAWMMSRLHDRDEIRYVDDSEEDSRSDNQPD